MDLKKAIIEYVKEFHREHRTAPSIRKIINRFEAEKLNCSKLYQRFPGGVAEICRLAEIPVPDRLARTRRAYEARMRAKDAKDGGAASLMRLTLTEEQTKRLLAISHLEGKDEQSVLDNLLNYDSKLRKIGLFMEKIKRVCEAVDTAVSRGWKINSEPNFVDAVTKAYNLGMLHLPPETLNPFFEVIDWAKKKGWNAFDFVDYVTRHRNALMLYACYVKGDISYEEFRRRMEPYVQS